LQGCIESKYRYKPTNRPNAPSPDAPVNVKPFSGIIKTTPKAIVPFIHKINLKLMLLVITMTCSIYNSYLLYSYTWKDTSNANLSFGVQPTSIRIDGENSRNSSALWEQAMEQALRSNPAHANILLQLRKSAIENEEKLKLEEEKLEEEKRRKEFYLNRPLPERILIPSYPLRNLTKYSRRIRYPLVTNSISQCMPFNCSNDVDACDNVNPTNYKGTSPPCCVHVLRDMSRAFDQEMSLHGLDYASSFGILLGLWRDDRLIPWTSDNDHIIPSKAVQHAMIDLWNTSRTGLAYLYQGIFRMCATRDFANGKLAKWEIPPPERPTHTNLLWNQLYPYIDLYVGRNLTDTKTGDKYFRDRNCIYDHTDIFPTKRMKFYNGTLTQNVPANVESTLVTSYGNEWRVPSAKRSGHGGKACPHTKWVFKSDVNGYASFEKVEKMILKLD